MSVWEKVEEQVDSLVKKSNFKQCYQIIDQYKKRYPKSTYLQILEAYVKYKQSPGKFDYETTLGTTYGLGGNSFTTDQDALNLLHRFFFEFGKYEEALYIFEKANSKQPSFEISYLWFDYALRDFNFKHLGKASLQLSKFPKDSVQPSREYQFWNAIATISLFKFQNYRLSAQEKQILPVLAYKNLCAAKPFKTTQEVIVFCTVCEELFPNDETKSLEIINEIQPHLNMSVDLYSKNFFLKHVKKDNHELILSNCSKMLRSLDDYDLLKNIVISGKALSKSKQDLYILIDELFGAKSRNARLIRFEIDIIYGTSVNQDSIEYYLEKFHNKPCCVADLSHYMDKLDRKILVTVFNKYNSESDPVHDSNLLKLKIGDSLNPVEYYNKHKQTMENKSNTDYSLCSTFILEVIKDILLANSTLDDIIFALSILENYQMKDPYNYDTKVWIIALYMHLGLVPLAHSYYSDLKVKNVQVDSMDYLIYSRYSSLFPDKQHDYLNRTLSEHNALYDVSLGRLSQFINISFDRKSYSKIPGMFDFRDKLVKSVGRFSKICDLVNMSYLRNDKRTALLDMLRENLRDLEATGKLELSDNRDWSIFGYFDEFNKEELQGPLSYLKIDEDWIYLNLIKIFMIDAIPNSEKSQLVDKLQSKLSEKCNVAEHMTNAETVSYNIIRDLYGSNGANLTELINEINVDNSDTTSSWELVHTYVTHISTLKTLDRFKRIKDKDQKTLIKQKLTELNNHCDDMFQSYSKRIASVCDNLQQGERHDLLTSLGYTPLSSEGLTNSLLEVQKAIRNL